MMMGVGVLVLLLLIIGIGSALKAPSTSSSEPSASGEKSIDLSGNAADQANATQPAPGATSARTNRGQYVAGYFVAADFFNADAGTVTCGR